MRWLVSAVVLCAVCCATPAFAWDYYDDFTSYNTSMWTEIGDFDPDNGIAASVSGGNLNFTSDDAGGGTRLLVLNKALDFSHDFEFLTEYHYNHSASASGDEASLMAGIVSYTGDGALMYQNIEAGNWIVPLGTSGYLWNKNVYYSDGSMTAGESWASRNDSDGFLECVYDSYADTLTLSAYEWITVNDVQFYNEVFSTSYEGLQGLDVGEIQLFLGASILGTGTSTLGDGECYFKNFAASANVVPEPVSMALFAAGGAVLAVARKKRSSRSRG